MIAHQTLSTISVAPIPGGWMLDCALSGTPLLFRSGAQAERKAHQLAQVLVEQGLFVQVLVRDGEGLMIGSFVTGPGGLTRRRIGRHQHPDH